MKVFMSARHLKLMFVAAKCLLACQLLRNPVVVSESMEHMASVYFRFKTEMGIIS